jgi:hypothetical protein
MYLCACGHCTSEEGEDVRVGMANACCRCGRCGKKGTVKVSWAVGRKGLEKGVVCAMESKGGVCL